MELIQHLHFMGDQDGDHLLKRYSQLLPEIIHLGEIQALLIIQSKQQDNKLELVKPDRDPSMPCKEDDAVNIVYREIAHMESKLIVQM